jgi:hypothetical protein
MPLFLVVASDHGALIAKRPLNVLIKFLPVNNPPSILLRHGRYEISGRTGRSIGLGRSAGGFSRSKGGLRATHSLGKTQGRTGPPTGNKLTLSQTQVTLNLKKINSPGNPEPGVNPGRSRRCNRGRRKLRRMRPLPGLIKDPGGKADLLRSIREPEDLPGGFFVR